MYKNYEIRRTHVLSPENYIIQCKLIQQPSQCALIHQLITKQQIAHKQYVDEVIEAEENQNLIEQRNGKFQVYIDQQLIQIKLKKQLKFLQNLIQISFNELICLVNQLNTDLIISLKNYCNNQDKMYQPSSNLLKFFIPFFIEIEPFVIPFLQENSIFYYDLNWNQKFKDKRQKKNIFIKINNNVDLILKSEEQILKKYIKFLVIIIQTQNISDFLHLYKKLFTEDLEVFEKNLPIKIQKLKKMSDNKLFIEFLELLEKSYRSTQEYDLNVFQKYCQIIKQKSEKKGPNKVNNFFTQLKTKNSKSLVCQRNSQKSFTPIGLEKNQTKQLNKQPRLKNSFSEIKLNNSTSKARKYNKCLKKSIFKDNKILKQNKILNESVNLQSKDKFKNSSYLAESQYLSRGNFIFHNNQFEYSNIKASEYTKKHQNIIKSATNSFYNKINQDRQVQNVKDSFLKTNSNEYLSILSGGKNVFKKVKNQNFNQNNANNSNIQSSNLKINVEKMDQGTMTFMISQSPKIKKQLSVKNFSNIRNICLNFIPEGTISKSTVNESLYQKKTNQLNPSKEPTVRKQPGRQPGRQKYIQIKKDVDFLNDEKIPKNQNQIKKSVDEKQFNNDQLQEIKMISPSHMKQNIKSNDLRIKLQQDNNNKFASNQRNQTKRQPKRSFTVTKFPENLSSNNFSEISNERKNLTTRKFDAKSTFFLITAQQLYQKQFQIFLRDYCVKNPFIPETKNPIFYIVNLNYYRIILEYQQYTQKDLKYQKLREKLRQKQASILKNNELRAESIVCRVDFDKELQLKIKKVRQFQSDFLKQSKTIDCINQIEQQLIYLIDFLNETIKIFKQSITNIKNYLKLKKSQLINSQDSTIYIKFYEFTYKVSILTVICIQRCNLYHFLLSKPKNLEFNQNFEYQKINQFLDNYKNKLKNANTININPQIEIQEMIQWINNFLVY